ncbi:MAG: serine/threonine protein kinase [Polyangiaceae bacterium]
MANAESILVALPAMPKTGDVVSGKYRIESVIAEGGMGLVFEATHLQLEEKVAIKFLRIEYTGPQSKDLVERFVREAKTAAKIKSEHVARVHDVGSTDAGAPFIVMELLTGKDLDQLVTDHGALQIPQAVDYVLQACEALAEAHTLGIVHRDLKPANLFLLHRADGSPCVKVLDFGISKLSDAKGDTPKMGMTKTHAVMGSPRYMSPEQMRSSRDVDARADIWAIGIILYELLAGIVPFDGESMPQICAAILEQEPKSIRAVRPEIVVELEAIVTKCLAKNPDERFENVAHLARALSAFGSDEARASAERIARVLAMSGNDMTAVAPPQDFAIAFSGPVPVESGPSLVQRSARDRQAGWDSAMASIDIEVFNRKRRRRAIFALSAVLSALAGAGGAVFYVTKHPVATIQKPAPTPSPAVPSADLSLARPGTSAGAIEIPPPPLQVATSDAITSQTTTTAAKITTTKHAASFHHPRKPAPAQSTQQEEEEDPTDLWSGRK